MRTDVKIAIAVGLLVVLVGVIFYMATKGRDGNQPEITAVQPPENSPEFINPAPVPPVEAVTPSASTSPVHEAPPTGDNAVVSSRPVVPVPPVEPVVVHPVAPVPDIVPPLASKPASQEYVVVKGDTLYAIAAKKYNDGNKHNLIRLANPGINPNVLVEGSKLIIPPLPIEPAPVRSTPINSPAGGAGSYVVQPNDSFWSIAQKELGNGAHHDLIQRANPGVSVLRPGMRLTIPAKPAEAVGGSASQPAKVLVAGATTYTVVPGDSLYTISEKVYGDGKHYPNIVAANPEIKNGIVHQGQTLMIVPLGRPAPAGTASTLPARPSAMPVPARPAATPKASPVPAGKPDFGPL